MTKLFHSAAVSVLALGIPGVSMAQDTADNPLSFEMARAAMDAAEASARANGWNVSIVVTDAAGVPMYLRRLDGASPRSFEVALRKAATVVATGLATSVYGQQVEAGDIEPIEDGVTFAGGVPVLRGGEVIGAVATSGVQALQDEIVSQAGADAVGD